MDNKNIGGFRSWMESSLVKDAIVGIVSGGADLTDEEMSHLLDRKTTDFSSEIRNRLKSLGVVKSVFKTSLKAKITKSIDDGVSIGELVNMVRSGTLNESSSDAPEKKTLVLMRGVSGSGKTTVAARIAKERGGVVFSTDDFFDKDGQYEFDPRMLPQNHAKNQSSAEEAMRNGVSPIVIDNTNIQAWEMKPYVNAAKRHGYEVKIVEPGSPGFPEADFEEIMRRQKNRGGGKSMPEDVVRRMMGRFQRNVSVDEILDSRSPFGP